MRGRGPLGSDCIQYTFSEINFIKPEVAKKKMEHSFGRLASRFKKIRNYFGQVFIDSSAAGSGSFVDEFIENTLDPENTLVVRPNVWTVKACKGIYGNPTRKTFSSREEAVAHILKGGKIEINGIFVRHVDDLPEDFDASREYRLDTGWFKVYLGDTTRDAFVMHNGMADFKEGMDKDRILDVPIELYVEFCMNVDLSLQDHAGISTKASDLFIQDREAIYKTFTLPMLTKEVIEVDFYDRKLRLIDEFKEALKTVPRDKVLSLRFDIGVVADYTGLSIAYFDDWEITDKKNKTRVPKFKVPIACAVGRKAGQETSIRMLYEFVKDLSKDYEIGVVSFDTFQSRQLMQDLERDGFNAVLLSVDRTDIAYQYLKQTMYESRVEFAQSKLLLREFKELTYINYKVDHPKVTKADTLTFNRGSKDCADAVAGCIYAMTDDLEAFTIISKKYNRQNYINHMKMQTVLNKDSLVKQFKGMMKTGGDKRIEKKLTEIDSFLVDPGKVRLATEKIDRRYKSQYAVVDKD